MSKDSFLFIGDVHEHFAHPRALQFCKSLQKDFDIPRSNIYSVGDLTDQFFFGRWPKSPDAKHTPNQELDFTRERLRKWAHAFPEMKIATSNHDQRIMKKALGAELPSQVIRGIEEIYEFPKTWELRDQFIVMANKCEFLVEHGESFSCALQAAIAYGVSVVQGHHHQKAGVQYVKTRTQQLWGMATGCLVDADQYAFEYGRHNKYKPVIGSGVVVNGIPHFIPLI